MAQWIWTKDSIEIKPDGVLELVFIEKILKLTSDGDVSVCYRVNNPQGGIEKLVIESKKKVFSEAKTSTMDHVKRNAKEVVDNINTGDK